MNTRDAQDLPDSPDDERVRTDVLRWLEQTVIGLNLCPFAAHPHRHGRIAIEVTRARSPEALLEVLQQTLESLDSLSPHETETLLLAIPDMLHDFADYNDFLDLAELSLRTFGWEGRYQVASFHPHYRFAGTDADDPGNLTNCAPWPLLHLIREDSISEAVAWYEDIDGIPERNIRRMQQLSPSERHAHFPWRFADGDTFDSGSNTGSR